MPRLHFQQRHIRFSFRRFLLGFVCSGWTGASTFLQLQQLWSDRWGGTSVLGRAWRGPLRGRDLPRTSRPRASRRRVGLQPGSGGEGTNTRRGPAAAPVRRRALQFRPRWWLRARAAAGMGNREASKKETEKDKLNPWGGGGGRTLGGGGTRRGARKQRLPRGSRGARARTRPAGPPPPARGGGGGAACVRALPRGPGPQPLGAPAAQRGAWPRPSGLSRLPEERPRSGPDRSPGRVPRQRPASARLGAPVQEAAPGHGLRGAIPRDFRCGQCLEAPSGLSSRAIEGGSRNKVLSSHSRRPTAGFRRITSRSVVRVANASKARFLRTLPLFAPLALDIALRSKSRPSWRQRSP